MALVARAVLPCVVYLGRLDGPLVLGREAAHCAGGVVPVRDVSVCLVRPW